MNPRILRSVRNLNDLRAEKKMLQKKIQKQEEKIKDLGKDIKDYTSPSSVLSSVFEGVGIQSHLLPVLLPLVLKYRKQISNLNLKDKSQKMPLKVKIAMIAGVGGSAVFAAIKALNKKKNEACEENKDVETPDTSSANNKQA